nr:putative ribonuclease H-like domain-containing protein [Tanacetum cinerariifolium]
LPNWVHDAFLESSSSKPQDDCSTDVPKSSGNCNPTATSTNPSADQMESLTVKTPIPTVSSPVPTACLNDSPKPSNPSWVEDMQEELFQFKIQNVWTLVDCPKRVRPIGTKWVLKNKKDERRIVIRKKARLVAQGHTQEEGIDYDEVFAPVTRIETIRLFLPYASFMGFTVYQMDVKSAFLYGTIDEEVYVMQHPGFQDPEFPARVYKVEKTMYGLHQAPRAWYGTLSKYLLTNGFQRGDILKKFGYSEVRSSNTPMDKENPWGKDGTGKDGHPKLGLWYPKESPFDLVAYSDSDYGGATQDRKSTTGGCQFLGRRLISWQCKNQTIVATSTTKAEYVAAGSCCGQVLWIQNQLLDYGLSMPCEDLSKEISSSILRLLIPLKEDGIFLSQDKYVGDILKKFGYSDVTSSNTPMDKENPWGKDGTGKDVDLHLYRSMIGSLMYLTASRPDIMFAVCACAKHQVTPKECHLHVVKMIFKYLKGHPKLGLWYPKDSSFDLVAYSDSDYGGATQDRKSTSGGCQFLGKRLIS